MAANMFMRITPCLRRVCRTPCQSAYPWLVRHSRPRWLWVSTKLTISPLSLHSRYSLKPTYYPMALLPFWEIPLKSFIEPGACCTPRGYRHCQRNLYRCIARSTPDWGTSSGPRSIRASPPRSGCTRRFSGTGASSTCIRTLCRNVWSYCTSWSESRSESWWFRSLTSYVSCAEGIGRRGKRDFCCFGLKFFTKIIGNIKLFGNFVVGHVMVNFVLS